MVRKHKGIHQTGKNAGRLKKGFCFTGKKTTSGKPCIMKVRKVVKKQKGGKSCLCDIEKVFGAVKNSILNSCENCDFTPISQEDKLPQVKATRQVKAPPQVKTKEFRLLNSGEVILWMKNVNLNKIRERISSQIPPVNGKVLEDWCDNNKYKLSKLSGMTKIGPPLQRKKLHRLVRKAMDEGGVDRNLLV